MRYSNKSNSHHIKFWLIATWRSSVFLGVDLYLCLNSCKHVCFYVCMKLEKIATGAAHFLAGPTLGILLGLFKSSAWKNYLKQWSHAKHFSPVLILLCLFKSTTQKNYLKQWSHIKYFSLVWILLWLLNHQCEKFTLNNDHM